jgi:hypothetical protein
VAVFHDAQAQAQDDALRTNFVEYGRRLEALLARIRGTPVGADPA